MVYGADLGVGPANNDYIVSKKYSDKGRQYAIPADKKDSFINQKYTQGFNEKLQKSITIIAAFNLGIVASCLAKGTAVRKTAIGLATATVAWLAGHQVDKSMLKRAENEVFQSVDAQEVPNQA